ncbi:glycosyltransferase family 4 protein [Salinarchaeum laminariae]|uniref:glycosyltransferase family 4 protein n=1 Tax=Salinarchaeum laminariae TaxID=869888 RepID=UPI0020C14D21|nr:glycosyltransferase family 4 protein [Salinarchaeum laminariae]
MKVSHYFEWEGAITGGFAQSVNNQRTILDRRGVEYTTEPTLEADLLHLNNMGPRSIYYAKRARRAGVPVVAHTHNTAADFRESFVFSNVLAKPLRPYLAYGYSQADHLICPSAHNQDVIAEYTDTPSTVISNGFDADRFEGWDDPELRAEYLERYNLEPPVVFMFGHVIKRKGLRTFVETARAMPDLDFVWFGYINPAGGTLDKYLQPRETRQLVANSPENCTFTGYIEDPRGAPAAGDVFFWPSKNENEGMALLEAMHCGKPPVIRSIPTYEWLDDGEDCLKADEEFVEPLRELCEDPERRDAIGSAAARTSEQFSLDTVGDQLVTPYEELVDGRA